jgi:hypothetical protein
LHTETLKSTALTVHLPPGVCSPLDWHDNLFNSGNDLRMKTSKNNPTVRPMTDQAFPGPDDDYTRKPQSVKKVKPQTYTAYMPHINTWSDSRPQNKPGI